mgnify:CR=1 FL=1
MINLQEYGFSEDHQKIYDTVYKYSRDNLHPLIQKMDKDDWFPEEEYKKLADLGLLGMTVPERFGGAEIDFLSMCVVAEAMGHWNSSMAAVWMSSENVCVHSLVSNCTEDQKEKFLPKFPTGEYIGALGLTEPGAGSDAFGGMKTTAIKEGSDYIINGRKTFISNAQIASIVLTYTKTTPELGTKGISPFIIETDSEGFEVGQKLDKMGWRGCPTGEIVMDDVRVSEFNRIGPENNGASVAMKGLNGERLMLGFYVLGFCQRALDLSLEHAKTREQGGRPIAEYQLVQAMIADIYTELEALRCMTYSIALQVLPAETEGKPIGDAHKRAAAVYLKSGRVAVDILDKAVQIYGGMGYMRESEINILYRVAKLMEIGGGTTQIRQLLVSGALLK